MSALTSKVPKGYSQFSLPTMGQDQKGIYDLLRNQFMGNAPDIFNQLGGLAKGQSQFFEGLEAPAMRQFQEQIAPGIANRYVGSGIKGSSGINNSLASAGQGLTENLHSQRMGIHMNAISQLLGLGDLLLQTPTMQGGLTQKKPSFWQQLAGGLGQGVGQALPMAPFLFR